MRPSDFSDLFDLEESLWWFRGMRSITSSILDTILTGKVRRMILDAGCGAGGNLDYLERYANGGDVVGIDISSDALSFCRMNGAEHLAAASATDLPFPSSCFDLVTSFDVLVQIPGEEGDVRALQEMYRVLRPGGIAFVRAAAFGWMRAAHDVALSSQRRYSQGELQNKIKGHGFEILRTTYANTGLFPIAMLKRLVLEPLRLVQKGSDVRAFPSGLGWLDPIFGGVLSAEAGLLRSSRFRFPVGLSVICVAKKPDGQNLG